MMSNNIDSQIPELMKSTNCKESQGNLSKEQNHSREQFKNKILRHNALACSDRDELVNALAESENDIKALNAQSSLQEMLIAQMTSIHLLQQKTITLANRTGIFDTKQYLVNSSIKLANCFTQQAALLAKLQGIGGQKIVVEHVEVHHGGQAVVGNIQGAITSGDKA